MTIPDAAGERIVIAYYYIWFTKGWFDGSDAPSLKAAMSDIHPVIGPYDSHDPDVIAEHMKQCRKAKLDALAVSWYSGKRNNPRKNAPAGTEASQDDILESVMNIGHEHGLRVCVDLEAKGQTAESVRDALKYYLGRYANDPRALHANGKPVVLCWATWVLGPEVWTAITGKLRKEGLDGFYVASHQSDPAYLSFLDAVELYATLSSTETVMEQFTRARKRVDEYNRTQAGRSKPGRWHATLMPGFDARLIPGRLDNETQDHYRSRRCGYYYWESFAAAMASRPEWLHVNSFNELAEHSHIEETEEYGDLYLRLTAKMIEDFKANAAH